MTRKSFLKTGLLALAGVAVLPISSLIKENKPKLGYIDLNKIPLGTNCGDWCIYDGNIDLCKNNHINAANDIEGWYQTFDGMYRNEKKIYNSNIRMFYKSQTTRVVSKYLKFL